MIRSIPAVALAVALSAGPALSQASFGSQAAIAFSPSTFLAPEGASRGWGISWGWGSRSDAQRVAMQQCNNNDPVVTDCRIVLSFSRGCGAMAVGVRGVSSAVGTGQGASLRAARAAARADCGRRGSNCRDVAATCARNRDRP